MAKYWSASKLAFYDDTVISEVNLPQDAVVIPDDDYQTLMAQQDAGRVIVAGDDGYPTTIEQTCGQCTCLQHDTVIASAEALGHIKVGDGLEVSEDGTLKAQQVAVDDGLKISDAGVISADETVVRTSGTQSINGEKRFLQQVHIGSTDTTVFTGVQTARKCASDSNAINCAEFFVNSDGRAKFVHRRGGESADDDAYLVFNANGLYFSGSGTPGAETTSEHEVFHRGNLRVDGNTVTMNEDGVISAALKTINGNAPDESGNIAPSQTGCLPLTGGTLSGLLTANGGVTGNLNGNATTATKATQDSAGQQINTTYIKSVSVSGTAVTFTRGDNTTFTVYTQDTNTDTNSSCWSVSNGTNGWARDNSTGFTIQWGQSSTFNGWISFPRSFSNVYSVLANQVNTYNVGHSDWYLSTAYGVGTTGFSTFSYHTNGAVHFIAIGFS